MVDEVSCTAYALVAAFLGGGIGALFVAYLWRSMQRDVFDEDTRQLKSKNPGYE